MYMCALYMLYTCKCGCTCLCMHVWRSEVNFGHLSPLFLTFYFQINSFDDWEFIAPLEWLVSESRIYPCFPSFHRTGVTDMFPYPAFNVGAVDPNLFLCFYRRHLTHRTISPAKYCQGNFKSMASFDYYVSGCSRDWAWGLGYARQLL